MIVVPLYAGLLALWFVLLSVRVIGWRQRSWTSLGDGGDASALRVIRGHANFAEYVPLALVLLGFLELSHYSSLLLHALGLTLLIGRLLHGYSLSFTPVFVPGRVIGMMLTCAVLLIAGLLCVYQGVLGFRLQ